MEQTERIGDREHGLRLAIQGMLAEAWTAMPGIIVSFNAEQCTAVVQMAIKMSIMDPKGNTKWEDIKPLLDVPVCFPCGGGFAVTFPIKPGDEVLVVFASRCIDAWWQQGEVQRQSEFRMHDLSDGFAIPGPRSIPNVLENISTTTTQIRNGDGSAFIELAPGGVVNIKAPGGVNINGAVNITGNVAVDGDQSIDGELTVTGEGTFNGGHTVSAHLHGGVQSGGSTTDPPTG